MTPQRLLIEHDCSATLLEEFTGEELPAHKLRLAWLGQAGFLLQWGACRMVIDPYLSDSLAKKYQGTEFPHVRMMQPPVNPDELTSIQYVLITHAHTDHMDPDTLRPLAAANPACRFIVPAAEREKALQRGIPADRLVLVDDGLELPLEDQFRLTPVAAAHEQLRVDSQGQHHFLGFLIANETSTIYHSGDCVPYDGLDGRLEKYTIDLAILPINGRDKIRRSRGVPGNFHFEEAIALCRNQAIPNLVPCHFGMFEFNTVDPATVDPKIQDLAEGPRCVLPRTGCWYELQDNSD